MNINHLPNLLSSCKYIELTIIEENELEPVTIQNKVAQIASLMTAEKEQYQAEQNIYNQVHSNRIVC